MGKLDTMTHHTMTDPVTRDEAPAVTCESPRTHDGAFRDAFALAKAESEPVFVPIRTFADDRGWSMMNLMVGVLAEQGQINFSTQYPGVIKAWHRHTKQTDFWTCPMGHIKAGVYREDDGRAWVQILGEQRPGVLIIPPPLWHGAATVGPTPAGLLYYVTHAFDPNDPDEFRRPHDSVPGFPWAVRHG
jgi:dTDP-4-dehydrorhamnose 3,5-epimerase